MSVPEQRPPELVDPLREITNEEPVVMYASMPELAERLGEVEQAQREKDTRRRLAEARLGPYNHISYENNIGFVVLHEQLRISP